MRKNILKKTKLSLILLILTFLTSTTHQIVNTYGGLMEASAQADASSSFDIVGGQMMEYSWILHQTVSTVM